MISFRLSSLSVLSTLLFDAALVPSSSASSRDDSGYQYGQSVPVSCLNRTIDSGEHIRDSLGRLQYIPFPTCNETSTPLALRYGVTETVTCTIDALPDTLYHLLEYYVHSDAPLTCRIPTVPLSPALGVAGENSVSGKVNDGAEYSVVDVDGDDGSGGGGGGPPYTPLTMGLQGTLQRSHLHIWTDMNVLLHHISSMESPRDPSIYSSITPGYVVAGTAYSLPELHSHQHDQNSDRDEDMAMIENARNPWTAGHGTKVIRGEPLTLRFRVSWVAGADSLGWTDHDASVGAFSVFGFLSKLVFFAMAVGLGASAASYYERARRGGWRGDGILGRPLKNRRSGSVSGVVYGNGGRTNGYGGFSQTGLAGSPATGTDGGYGYGGYGKKD